MKQTSFHRNKIQNTCTVSFVVTALVLFAFIIATSYMIGPASAQITPSAITTSTSDSLTSPQSSVLPESLPSLDSEIRPVAQDIADLLQNNTVANITQLATIPPTINQPVLPASSLAPVSAESSDDSDESSSSNDEDESDSSSSSDNYDDDSGDDDGDDSGDDGDDGESSGAFD